jgi:hypothetical protein
MMAYGTVQLYIHSPLISKLDAVKWSVTCYSCLVTCKGTPVHTSRESCDTPRAGLEAAKKQI